MKNDTLETNIGELVASDYRTAAIFNKYEIDFCCNGNRTIEEACLKKNINPGSLKQELTSVMESSVNNKSASCDYTAWPLDLLTAYIEKKHHRYVIKQVPVLKDYLLKLCKVHGLNHPELIEISGLFSNCASELLNHMKKEEQILFPFIKNMEEAKEGNGQSFSAPFGTVQNPIRMMMLEHDTEGERFRKIKALSNNYTPPPDACNTYKVTYSLLREFEEDLHLHIHLENNILFPRSIELEKTFAF